MNAANVILRGFTPRLFAISAAFSFSAEICGAAISFALSYVIAPAIIQALILYSCFVCSIALSLSGQVKADGFIMQGVYHKYFKKTVKNSVLMTEWKRYA
jgi:hypothetical protein